MRNFSSVGEHPETLEGRALTKKRGSILFSSPLADAAPHTRLINKSFAETTSVGLRSGYLGCNKFLLSCPLVDRDWFRDRKEIPQAWRLERTDIKSPSRCKNEGVRTMYSRNRRSDTSPAQTPR